MRDFSLSRCDPPVIHFFDTCDLPARVWTGPSAGLTSPFPSPKAPSNRHKNYGGF